MSPDVVTRSGRVERLRERLDPTISTLAKWADENPDAMRRLLSDPALQRQLLAALDDVVGPGAEGDRASGAEVG